MTDIPQPEELPETGDLNLVQQYRKLVLTYEALDEEIDALLARHDGATENMSDEDYDHYRALAYRRDDIYNQMKAIERQILDDDNE
ncbi:MAG: hypothetical protein GYB65_05560 [Chloroflexi bacterium]|nr:hypothetical protein [Chloroflexota bacterium]